MFLMAAASGQAWQWESPPIPPQRTWRDASLPFGGVRAHTATVDADGTLFLATLEALAARDEASEEVVLRVRAWDGVQWNERFGWPMVRPTEGSILLDLTVDDQGQAWVAWSMDHRALHVLREGDETPWSTATPADTWAGRIGLDPTTQPISLVVAVDRQSDEIDDEIELWHFAVGDPQGRRLARGDEVAVARAHGRTAFTVTRYGRGDRVVGTWPRTVRRPRARWNAPVLHPTRTGGHTWERPEGLRIVYGGGPGRPLTAVGEARFVGTHYGTELNRLVIHQAGRSRPLAPPGTTRLRVPHRLSPDHTLFTTPEPLLVLGLHDGVGILRWTGTTWWGLHAQPDPAAGLGDPERPSFDPWFDGASLRWLEQDDDVGHIVVEQSWTETGWGQPTRRAAPVRIQLGGDFTNVALARVCDTCTWDRLWGADQDARLLEAGPDALDELPMPSTDLCGGDPEQHGCDVRAARRGRDGVLRAVARVRDLHGGRFSRVPEHWSMLRLSRWAWIHEATVTDVPSWADVALLDSDTPTALFVYRALGEGEPGMELTRATMASHDGDQ